MLFFLANAIQWIKSGLRAACGQDPGADELMPVFVYCLACSRPPFLPAMIAFIERFVDAALKETSFLYYIEQLKSSLEFITDRTLPVQPFLLFPFTELPDRLTGRLTLTNDEPLTIKGFEVWAFPTFSEMVDTWGPALIRYTGSEKVARVYQFRVDQDVQLVPNRSMDLVPTLKGAFLHFPHEMIAVNQMIEVEDGDFVSAIPNIVAISGMMIMSGVSRCKPTVVAMNRMYSEFCQEWASNEKELASRKKRGPLNEIRQRIAEMQKALVLLQRLPASFPLDGRLNVETLHALQKYYEKEDGRLVLRPYDYRVLVRAGR